MGKLSKLIFIVAIVASSPLIAQQYETIPISLGMRISTLRYTEVGMPARGVMPVFSGKEMGFVDYSGEALLSPTYEKDAPATSYQFHDGRMKVKKNGKYGFINDKLEEVIPCQYDEANDFANNFASVKKNGFWGIINTNNESVTPFGYKKISPFVNGMAAVVNESDSIGFLNQYGLIAIPFSYDNIGEPQFSADGICKISQNGKWFYIDKQGNNLGENEQKALQTLSLEQSNVPLSSIDSVVTNNAIKETRMETRVDIPAEIKKITAKKFYKQVEAPYESIGDFKDDFAIVCSQQGTSRKKYGVIKITDGMFSKEGKEVIPCEFDNIEGPFSGATEYFIVEKANQYGAYKTDGTLLLPCEYQFIGKEGSKFILIEKNDLYGFAHPSGKVAIPCKFIDARPFNEQHTLVAQQKKDEVVWNIIDANGNIVQTPEYKDAGTFQNGICPVLHKEKWGLIDQNLELIASKFDYTFSDDNEKWSYGRSKVGDLIAVSKEGKFGFINTEGKMIIKPKYDDAFSFVWGTARVQLGGKYGLIDPTGKEILPLTYQNIEYDFDHKVIIATKAGKKGLYEAGKFVLPCEYSSIEIFEVDHPVSGKRSVYAQISKNGFSGIYDITNHKTIIDCKYSSIVHKYNVFELNNGENYLTLEGTNLTSAELEKFASSKQKEGKYCLVGHDGKPITAYIFDYVGTFRDGYAPVKIVTQWGVIDNKGKIVIPCIYEDAKIVQEGIVSVRVLAQRGLTNLKGEPLLPQKGNGKRVEWISTDPDEMKVEAK